MFIAASYNLLNITNGDSKFQDLLDNKIYTGIDKFIVADSSTQRTMRLSGKFLGKILWYLVDIDQFEKLNSVHLITLTSTSKFIHVIENYDNFDEEAKDLFLCMIDDKEQIEQVIKHVVKLDRAVHSKYKLTFVTTNNGRALYYDCVIKALDNGKTELSVNCYSFYFTFMSIRSMLIDLLHSNGPRGREILGDLELLSGPVKDFEFTEQMNPVMYKIKYSAF